MEKNIEFVSPFKKMCITLGNLPTAYLESMSYYEALTFLVNYLENNVIKVVNNNSEVVVELQEKFTELKNYVDTYFDNLDLQEEVNNKLDAMVDDGTFDEIINQELFSDINNNIEDIKNNNYENPIYPAINNFGYSPKIVKYHTTNHQIDVIQKTNSGYLRYLFNNVNGDSGDTSVGTNWDLIRLTKIQSSYKCYLAKTTFTTEDTIGTTAAPSTTSTPNLIEQLLINNAKFKTITEPIYEGTTIGCYSIPATAKVTYTINTRLQNKINLMFLCLATASNNSDQTKIYLNDNLVDTIDLRTYSTSGNSIYIHEINVPYRPTSTTYTIKVENACTNSKATYICCANYVELENYNGEDVDCFKAFMFDDYYINSGGSSDYAIYDTDLSKWCGSYHGGETAVTQRMTYPMNSTIQLWKENYHVKNISDISSSWFVTPSFTIEQVTNINNKGYMISKFDLSADGILDMIYDFEGDINTNQFYTALNCNHTDFTIIKNPGNTSISENGYYYLKQNGGLIDLMSSDLTKEQLILYSKFSDLNHTLNTKNGWIQATSYYNKYYYGYVDNPGGTPYNVKSVQFRKTLISRYI